MKNLTKIITTIAAFFVLTSCQSMLQKELEQNAKSSNASSRIEASDKNSQSIFKEIDE